MENENTRSSIGQPFNFFENSDVKEKFADLNIELLSGKHIQRSSNYYLYQLLNKYYDKLRYYYDYFYSLRLEREFKDNITFYFLNFNEDTRGALSSNNRFKELSPLQTVMGIMLLNMYYDKYFDDVKEITFSDIKKEIKEGENSQSYKKLWFDEVREDYSPSEWKRVKTNVKNTVRDFDRLGWVKSMTPDEGEDIRFRLKEPIYRFQKLYEKEILNFDDFIENYLLQVND